MTTRKPVPPFQNKQEEAAFWHTHDSTEFVDWSAATRGSFPELKRSTKTISLRLPESLLHRLKTMANKRDVPYQSLMKMILSDAAQQDQHH